MKKIIALLILILALPSVTALAASVTSKSFVVRNWMATPPEATPTPDPTPVTTPSSTTPAPTDDVEIGDEPEEPEEQGEEPLVDDEPLTADDEQDIPSVDEDADGQGESAADDHADAPDDPDADEAPPPEPTTDQVEQSKEPAMDDTPAEDGEEEITITTEEEPEDVGEARVDIGGSGRRRRAKRLSEARQSLRRQVSGSRRAIKGYNHDL